MPKRTKIHGESDRETAQASSTLQRDQLEYIADLVLELKGLAHSQHLTTLAGILDLAHAEAQQRLRDDAA